MRISLGCRQLAHHLLMTVLIALSNPTAAESLLIGAEDDARPWSWLKDGEIQGVAIDIVKAAFAATNTPIELRAYPYSRCMHMVAQKQLIACFSTPASTEVAKEFLLSTTPLFTEELQLWARSGVPQLITDLNQIGGAKVAITIGYQYGDRVDNAQQLVKVPVRKDLLGFLMLQHQRVDYSIAFRGVTIQLLREHPELVGQFIAVADIDQLPHYISFSRNNPAAPALLERFEQGMRLIHSNGRYAQILRQWEQHATP